VNLKLVEGEKYDYDKVTSIYDESYNHTIVRTPSFGVGPALISPKLIQNGIYLPDDKYSAARKWQWPNGEVTSLQALIAQQLLMYNSKPNSVITGTLLAREEVGEILDYNCLWFWRGKLLALVSGQLDLLTGHIESAKLREFLPWPEVWPEEGLMITEDGESVITHDFKSVNIGK
jgi:hypothetical protein